MIRTLILLLLAFSSAGAAQAQQPAPPGWTDHPRWCRHYSQHDYWRELHACGEDHRCRHDVRRKAESCGLR